MLTADPCRLAFDTAATRDLAPEGEVYRFRFACPVDADHGRSCTCVVGADGRAVLYCDRGCETDAVTLALGLKPRDLAAPPPAAARTLEPVRTIEVVNLAGITPRNPRFLWYPYLPLGKLVIVAGAPGNGKSQLAALISGLATRGALPGDIDEPSRVCMMCAEDDLDDTVVPRLLAVNADIRRIDTINVRTEYPDGLTSTGMISLPGDVGSLHELVRRHPDMRLVVMDPVASFFDRHHDAHNNQDVRAALGPLVAIAQTYGVTVVIILHLNKSEARDFASRIAESHGFQALARSVMALGPDPEDPDRERGSKKALVVTKANLVKPGNYGLRCEVRGVTLNAYTPPITTSELVLLGKCDLNADDLLVTGSESAARLEVAEWLAEFVGAGWVKVTDAKKVAISDGLSWRAIDRIARAKGYQRTKVGYQGQWWLGAPRARARDIPLWENEENGTFEALEGSKGVPQIDKEIKGPKGDTVRARAREEDLGTARAREANGSLEDYRAFEQRKLGERDD